MREMDGPPERRDSDEYVEMAERELEQAVEEWNEEGEILSPDRRVGLAQVYALTSIARSLQLLVEHSEAGNLRMV